MHDSVEVFGVPLEWSFGSHGPPRNPRVTDVPGRGAAHEAPSGEAAVDDPRPEHPP